MSEREPAVDTRISLPTEHTGMTRHTDTTSTTRRGFVRAGLAGATATGALSVGAGGAAAAYDGWLDDVDNYDGTHDYRGEEVVHVDVGAGMGLSFDPAAILIDEGTTVVWEWTGEGGEHNVAERNDAFESDLAATAGHTFEHTFDDVEEGDTFEYVCTPHEAVDMKGVVAIGDVDDTLVETGGGGGDGASRERTPEDFGALALAFGFAGALLVPLFYAGHKKAKRNR